MSETILRFVHISDTHLSPDSDYGLEHTDYSARAGAEALVEQLNHLPFTPDFVLHTGDVVYDPHLEAYETAREVLGKIRYPVYYVAGNHDEAAALQTGLLGQASAVMPYHYNFEVNGVQIVCLDSNGQAEVPRGHVSDEQLVWLGDICAKPDDRPLVVAVHHNPLPVNIPWLDEYMRIVNGEALHQTLLPAQKRLRGVFFGHIHQNVDMYRDGILYSSAASSWVQFHAWPEMIPTTVDRSALPGFNVVTLTRNQTYIRRCSFRVKSK